MGLSENSVPLHPMVLLIIIPMKNCYFIGNIPNFQTNPYEILIEILVGNVYQYMGLSENSVPLHPMVNDHYPY